LILGMSPTGRTLSETMPRYLMDKDEMEIMIYYLKHLSSTLSPGVNEDEMRFATIVADSVSANERDAMLQPLEAYFREEWNGRLVPMRAAWNARWLGNEKSAGMGFRKALLDVWELKGPPESWPKQLEAYYKEKPVFAVLGGLVPGKWEPIHSFCEANKIPCIFPLTDLPVVSRTDWYTLYFSKGYYQEGETAAKYLSRVIALPAETKVVQVYRETGEGKALADGFTDTWKKLGSSPVKSRIVAPTEKTGKAFWKTLAENTPGAVILVWLPTEELDGIATLMETINRPSTLFLSSSMLKGAFSVIPEKMREFTFITYPNRLPGDEKYSSSMFTNWMKLKKIPLKDMTISSKVFLMTRLLSSALVDLGMDYYREFFMDILDCGKDQVNASVIYPVLSFGPSQRYASKGCYVVTLGQGENPKVTKQSDWVVY